MHKCDDLNISVSSLELALMCAFYDGHCNTASKTIFNI